MTSPSLAPKLVVPRILWGALLVSQAIYVGMLVAGVIERPEQPPDPMMLPALIGAAMTTAIASFFVPEIIRRGAIARMAIELHDVPDPEAPLGFRGAAPTVRAYAHPKKVIDQALPMGFAPFIISLAMGEAVSLFGLVAGVLGHPPTHWAGFFALGMTLTAIRFPTTRTFLGPIEKHTGIALPR